MESKDKLPARVSPYMADLVALVEQEMNDALDALHHGQVELADDGVPFVLLSTSGSQALYIVLKNKTLLPMRAALLQGNRYPTFSVTFGTDGIEFSDHVSERLSFLMDGIVVCRDGYRRT